MDWSWACHFSPMLEPTASWIAHYLLSCFMSPFWWRTPSWRCHDIYLYQSEAVRSGLENLWARLTDWLNPYSQVASWLFCWEVTSVSNLTYFPWDYTLFIEESSSFMPESVRPAASARACGQLGAGGFAGLDVDLLSDPYFQCSASISSNWACNTLLNLH